MTERELTVADRRFLYRGPVSGLSVKADGASRDIMLHDGAEISLPPDHPIVARLIARGHLTPVVVAVETAELPASTSTSLRPSRARTSAQENS